MSRPGSSREGSDAPLELRENQPQSPFGPKVAGMASRTWLEEATWVADFVGGQVSQIDRPAGSAVSTALTRWKATTYSRTEQTFGEAVSGGRIHRGDPDDTGNTPHKRGHYEHLVTARERFTRATADCHA